MNAGTFIDTNVLTYAHDSDAKGKHAAAKSILHELWSDRNGVLSPQVLQEFYANVTKKIPHPLSKESARFVVSAYAIWCIDTTSVEILNAFRIEDESRIGLRDALIVASALKGGAGRILSEDMKAGQTIAGMRIENPFVQTR
jgi:predicted nucleic acid-binding protein